MEANTRGEHARAIFNAGIAAAEPGLCVHRALSIADGVLQYGTRHLPLDSISHLRVIGAGKATPAMALAAEEILGDRIEIGAINTKYGHALTLQRIETFECGHPVPDAPGVAGAQRQLELLEDLDSDALVLCLFSGGGSVIRNSSPSRLCSASAAAMSAIGTS